MFAILLSSPTEDLGVDPGARSLLNSSTHSVTGERRWGLRIKNSEDRKLA